MMIKVYFSHKNDQSFHNFMINFRLMGYSNVEKDHDIT